MRILLWFVSIALTDFLNHLSGIDLKLVPYHDAQIFLGMLLFIALIFCIILDFQQIVRGFAALKAGKK